MTAKLMVTIYAYTQKVRSRAKSVVLLHVLDTVNTASHARYPFPLGTSNDEYTCIGGQRLISPI